MSLEIFNRVRLQWFDDAGTVRFVTVNATPDPLAYVGIVNEFPFSLADPQPDDTTPTQVATTILQHISQPRYQGQLTIADAVDLTGGGNAFEVRSGDVVDLQDFGSQQAIMSRIGSVTYRPTSHPWDRDGLQRWCDPHAPAQTGVAARTVPASPISSTR